MRVPSRLMAWSEKGREYLEEVAPQYTTTIVRTDTTVIVKDVSPEMSRMLLGEIAEGSMSASREIILVESIRHDMFEAAYEFRQRMFPDSHRSDGAPLDTPLQVVAIQDDTVIGNLCIVDEPHDLGMVRITIVVSEEYRWRGIGRQLMELGLQHQPEHHSNLFYVRTDVNFYPFFVKFGFRKGDYSTNPLKAYRPITT